MKHKLLPIFLMLTAVPLFLNAINQSSFAPISRKASEDCCKASSFAKASENRSEDRQPINAELLTHLKQVKADALYMQKNNKDFSAILMGKQVEVEIYYVLLTHIWKDLFEALDPSETQITITAQACFNLICQKQVTLLRDIFNFNKNDTGSIFTTILTILKNSEEKKSNNKKMQKEHKLVFSVLAKYTSIVKDKDYIYNIARLDNLDFVLTGGCVYEVKILNKLLPKIDEKIAELETQL